MLLPKQVSVLTQVKTSKASKNGLSKARWTVYCLCRAKNFKTSIQESNEININKKMTKKRQNKKFRILGTTRNE